MNSLFLEAIGQGVVLGFGLAFLIGPAFFALLQASIDHGFGVSVALALGVVVSDSCLMAATYSLLTQLQQIPHFNEILGLVGGFVLVGTGISGILRPPPAAVSVKITIRDLWPLFRKGFSINTFNPFPWMFWLSTSSMVAAGVGKTSSTAAFLFFMAAALTVFLTDTLKAWAAQFIIRYLNPFILKIFRIISGICLIGFGLKLFWFAYSEWTKLH